MEVAGALFGAVALGWMVGLAVIRSLARLDLPRTGDPLESLLVFVAAPLTYLCASALHLAGAAAVFVCGLALAHGGRWRAGLRKSPLGYRTMGSAARIEVFLGLLLAVLTGALLPSIDLKVQVVALAGLLLLLVRPLAVRVALMGVPASAGDLHQLEWFGVRGVGVLYCASLMIERVPNAFGRELASAAVLAIAGSMTLGVLGALWQRRGDTGTVDL